MYSQKCCPNLSHLIIICGCEDEAKTSPMSLTGVSESQELWGIITEATPEGSLRQLLAAGPI